MGGSNLGVDNPVVYEIDLHTMTWTVNKAQKPSERDSIDEQTACLHGDKIYLFGGNIHGFKSNSLWIFDTIANKWSQANCKTNPPERSSHSSIVHGDMMYVFGGKDCDNNKLGDFWAYNFTNNEWTEVKSENDDCPLSRSGHSSGAFKNFIIIYGGIHELTQELSDMYLYDITRKKWVMIFEEEHSPVHRQNIEHTTSFSMSSKLGFTN